MYEIACPSCDTHFKQKKNLYAHIRNTHSLNPELTGSLLCPVENCSLKTRKYKWLREHLATSHGVKCENEVVQLKSWEEFVKWKQDTESAENNAYVLSTGSVTLATQERKTYYSCHRTQRSGTKSKQPHKMSRKSPGTKKILKTCPSTIEASINKIGVSVVRWKTHWGHFDDTSNVESNLSELVNSPGADCTFGVVTGNPTTECSLLTANSAYHNDFQVISKTDILENSCNGPALHKSHESDVSTSGSVPHADKNDIVSLSDSSGKPHVSICSALKWKDSIKSKLDLLQNHIAANRLTASQCSQLNTMLDQCVELCMQTGTA